MKFALIWCSIFLTILIPNADCLGDESKDHVCFRAIDRDQDGKVTLEEFKVVFDDGQQKFKMIDLNEDGTISHDEYHRFIAHGDS